MLFQWVVEFYHIDIQYIRDMQNLVFQKQSTSPCAPLCMNHRAFLFSSDWLNRVS